MRVAFFSPMPPARSGIADYAAALAQPLARLCDLDVFSQAPRHFDPSNYDAILYQMGNNPFHGFTYEFALKYPGVVVMHESNLHHLIADITIKQGDWDAYMREVEFDGGPQALAFAQRVRRLEVGPDYDGVPMLRRLMAQARAAVVHSQVVADDLRAAGLAGPIARIQHGAWIPDPPRQEFREKLGVRPNDALIGIFGFLKPYKRIAESLRAFKRLVRLEPSARMILVGEPHPDFPLASLIRSLELDAHVRVLGYTPIEHFEGYLAACDILLNLRFPTVGESSGTLMRALGMGKAVLVSNVGSFAEFPDTVCLKTPVDASEEDLIFEYLNLLVSRPEARHTLGAAARDWLSRNCTWEIAAARYASFLEAVSTGQPWSQPPDDVAAVPAPEPPPASAVDGPYILNWVEPAARSYAETHITRFEKTLELTPRGGPDHRILEMGAYMQITPALKHKLGYGEVRGCYYGPSGATERRSAHDENGAEFSCDVDLFDAEKDPFPYPDGHFHTVLCCELLEHLTADPMHMMCEINRILAPGGHLVLTTPNSASLRAISAILQGYHPGFFPAYIRPREDGAVDARHNREYTAREMPLLFSDAGFEITCLETGPFKAEPKPELLWTDRLLEHYSLDRQHRGDGIYAVGRKTGPPRHRYPAWLYN